MRLIRDLGERARTTGAGVRDLINTFQELKDAILSIDKKRIPNPKEAIQALRRSVSVVRKAGLDELKKLREAIQDLQDAIDSLRTRAETQMPDLPVAEWWWNLKNVLDKLKKAIPSINEIQIPRVDDLPLDKIAEVIAGFGVPGLVLVMLMTSSPWFGAAAITSSLAALGPFGMLGGIAALGVLQFMSRALTKFGFEKVFSAVIVKLEEDGKTCEEIREEIGKYPISEELKQKLAEDIKKFYEEENHEQ
jgi:hypothetical protein